MTPNERLRSAREARGLSEDDVAEAAALPVTWYRDLELFEDELTDNVSLVHLQIIAGTLGASPAEIFGFRRSQEKSECISTISQRAYDAISSSPGWMSFRRVSGSAGIYPMPSLTPPSSGTSTCGASRTSAPPSLSTGSGLFLIPPKSTTVMHAG